MAQILVIDDDDQVRKMLCFVLTQDGHEVVGAEDGFAGLQAYNGKKFDLVITDLIMPDKEGIETILEIRRLDPEAKIIAISGGGRVSPESYLTTAVGLGAAAALEKPFTRAEIIDAVNKLLDS